MSFVPLIMTMLFAVRIIISMNSIRTSTVMSTIINI